MGLSGIYQWLIAGWVAGWMTAYAIVWRASVAETLAAMAGVVLGTRWHFDLGLLQGKVHKARAEYQRLLHTRDVATLSIPIEVAQAYQEAVEHLNAFRASEQAALAARKWLVAALSTFDMGVGQARDIFLALDRYGKNRGDYLSSLLNYHLALARLSYAIGAYRTPAE